MAGPGKFRSVQRSGSKNSSRGRFDSKAGGFEKDKFFQGGGNSKKRRRGGDEEVLSSEDEDEEVEDSESGEGVRHLDDEEGGRLSDPETADQKRLRIAKAYLDKVRNLAKGDEADDQDGRGEEDDEVERTGLRDTLVADLLKQQQLEDSGRLQRKLASRVVKTSFLGEGQNAGRRHRHSVTAVVLTEDDSRGFAASKDGLLVHWDIETGQNGKYEWPTSDASTSSSGHAGGAKFKSKRKDVKGGSKHILALAVSTDGRYLAAGGLDRTVHLWDTRSREHIQAFSGHKGAITCLAFRQGTQQLMSGSNDRTIKLWSADDRSYTDTLYGHQSEVLDIDCLRQERILSAGRDRTLRYWKIPEETQLVFRGHAASMDCCCFLSNSEFLSGSDDGSLALWNTIRKKPVCIVRDAHATSSSSHAPEDSGDETYPEEEFMHALTNGHAKENGLLETASSAGPNPVSAGGGGAAASWIGAVAVSRGSDLAASGAGDGSVRLWGLEDSNRSLKAVGSFPVKGFVNALAFAHSGRFLLAGSGQEPRLGRWGHIAGARNGVVRHTINFSQ